MHYYGTAEFTVAVRKVYLAARENISKRRNLIQATVHSKINVINLCFLGTGTHKTDHLTIYDGPGDKSSILYSAYSRGNCTFINNLKSTGAMLTIDLFQERSDFYFYSNITSIDIIGAKYILTKTKNTSSSQSYPG